MSKTIISSSFLRSNIYKGVLDAAKAKGSKRKFFQEIIIAFSGKKRIFDVIKELSGSAVSTKKTPMAQKHHKMSRGSGAEVEMQQSLNSASNLPKQFSSDSLPLKSGGTSPSLQLPNTATANTGNSPSVSSRESKK